MINKKFNGARKRRLSILIAEDDADTVLMLAEMLRDEGHLVNACVDANFVIQAVSRYKPGFSIVRGLVAMKVPTRPLLIALSGVFNKPSDEIVAKTAGFDLLVRKGGHPRQLLRIVDDRTTFAARRSE